MMHLYEMIDKRKSFRSYTDVPLEDAVIDRLNRFLAGARRLYPELPLAWEILPRQQVRCIFPWVTPQVIAIYTDDSERAAENAGFVFQQADLYLQSLGIGTCWLGMGRLDGRTAVQDRNNNLRFAMMMAFGTPKKAVWRNGAEDFKRRTLAEISDTADVRLEPARLAPSSVNSQPWYFVCAEDVIHVYCKQQGLLKRGALSEMNRIDMGIALAHLYVANAETFRFYHVNEAPSVKGHSYIGSVTL